MAIQNRRGIYSDFDPTKMVEGEFAVVQSGDPDTIDGKAVYVSTQTGSVERVALYKDVTQAVSTAIDEVTEDIIEDINEGVAENVERAETAAENAEASAEEAAEILENKADIDGIYDELYAGNLISDKMQTDKTPYLFRKTAGGLSRIGERCYETIIGASVGWNQLVQSGATSVTVQSGHKYYAKIDGTESLGSSTGSAITINDSANDMVIDMTQMLGSTIADYLYNLETATAGSGIAKLQEWGFLKGYQAYNAGSIESVEVTGKRVVGFNQWDEEWENGRINTTTGENTTGTGIRTKNYVPVIPSTTYYVKALINTFVIEYDADKNYVRYASYYKDAEYTTSSNAYYIRFYQVNITTYDNDICFNLSSDHNGKYEPYTSQTYALGNDTLRGIFKLDANNNLYADGDVKSADGTIVRKYGIVDLGSLNWSYSSTADHERFYTNDLSSLIKPSTSDATAVTWLICAIYSIDTVNNTYNHVTNKTISVNTAGRVYIYDSAYTDAATFKTAMSGVMLVYELATPTTETSTPFTSPQVCYPYGTEEFITENGVPVGHETEYPYDLKGLVEGLIDVPDVPSTNGTYVLKATRSASGISYEWVSET